MIRLAVLSDFPEEGWPSMDLAASMLVEAGRRLGPLFEIERVCPHFRRLVSRVPKVGSSPTAFNADRLLNRMWHYPRHAASIEKRFDLFHVADHSYSQLVHVLPPARTGVFCHDLDTFRSLLDPGREARPLWFRAIARRVLDGMRRAALVFHTTDSVREEILRHGLVAPERLVKAPLGVSAEFVPTGLAGGAGAEAGRYFLHVGSCIPRKRIDVLLDVFHRVRRTHPDLRLVQAGGRFTLAHRSRIEQLGLTDAVTQRAALSRRELAALYRGALLVLHPSEAEGFGLPLVEAFACGTAVLASDIPVLREVGGGAAAYASVGDVDAWAARAVALIEGPASQPPRETRLAQAARYSWDTHARTVLGAYERLARLAEAA